MKKRIVFVAFAALTIVLAVSAPSHAEGVRGHGFEGRHGGEAREHHGFEGHHFERHHFDGHRFEGRGFLFAPVFPYSAPYGVAPSYWYYCPSYGAYYPSVASCPEPWVTVPAE